MIPQRPEKPRIYPGSITEKNIPLTGKWISMRDYKRLMAAHRFVRRIAMLDMPGSPSLKLNFPPPVASGMKQLKPAPVSTTVSGAGI
jgi:hypothetical protein